MAIDSSYIYNPSQLTSSSVIMGKDASQLSMDDFFTLLVAQMTNQDMLNPTNDTEFIAQMAQFASLQGISNIQEYQISSYATSYVGKNVSIAYQGETGGITKTEGVVESVTFYDGEPQVVVNGISYPLYSVMEIKNSLSTDTGKDKDKDDEESGDDNKTDNIDVT